MGSESFGQFQGRFILCYMPFESTMSDIFEINWASWSWETIQDLGMRSIFFRGASFDAFCFSHVKGLENCVFYSPSSLHNGASLT